MPRKSRAEAALEEAVRKAKTTNLKNFVLTFQDEDSTYCESYPAQRKFVETACSRLFLAITGRFYQ
jgi:hypothetical protein